MRERLSEIYLDWCNNYLTIDKFSEHYGLTVEEGNQLLKLAKEVFYTDHPEQ